MENFDLGFFNQKKKDVSELAKKFESLVITEDNLEEGKEAIKELKTQRIEISKIGKDVRTDALAFQKEVIKLEKEILEIIKPLEESLVLQKLVIDNQEVLEERILKLKDVNSEIEESVLLKMNNTEFKKFYTSEQQKFLDEKVRIENEKKAKKEENERKLKAKRDAREAQKARDDKQKIIDKENEDRKVNEGRKKILITKGLLGIATENTDINFLFNLSDSEFLSLVEKCDKIEKEQYEKAEAE